LITADKVKRLQELRQLDKLTSDEKDELEALRNQVPQRLLGGAIGAQVEHLTSLLSQVKSEFEAQPDPSLDDDGSEKGTKPAKSKTSRKPKRSTSD
jgi:hypothetical protein